MTGASSLSLCLVSSIWCSGEEEAWMLDKGKGEDES